MADPYFSGSLRIACDRCDSSNEITVINLPRSEPVYCSHCHAMLGALGSLATGVAANEAAASAAALPAT